MMSEQVENDFKNTKGPFNDFNFSKSGFDLSPTVRDAAKRFLGETISAAGFVTQIAKHHNDFANGRLSSLSLQETPKKKTSDEWLEEVATLFDPESIRKISGIKDGVILHGRLVIVGLCLLEPTLRSQIDQSDIFSALIEEIKEPFDKIVTGRGRSLYKLSGDGNFDSVPNQPDNPVRSVEEDKLGRTAFARYLAKRISTIPDKTGAYSIHIYGAWGSGKSSLLNFIRTELEKENKWLVTEFNAWRNQHISPPWWSLMECVFRGTKRKLNWMKWFLEYWWRFKTGRVHYLIGLVIFAWILAFVIFPVLANHSKMEITSFGVTAENLSKVIALLLTTWGIVAASSRSLILGSAKAAKSYVELTHDPMNNIRQRFNDLIKRLEPGRVIVFIDDLDRCRSSYAVELLEGIQTLFRDASVVFIVAADRHWLNACYEEVYEKIKPMVTAPGKDLGTLFLEKAFQFTAPVPGIPKELKELYWQSLIQLEKKGANNSDDFQNNARTKMSNAPNEATVLNLLKDSENLLFEEQMAIREEAIVRLAAPDVVQRTEHTLKPFADRLDTNPRSMKRLVNAYSVNRALAILAHVEIELDHLVRWTILSLQWPLLAKYLEENPNLVEKDKNAINGFPDEIKNIWENHKVCNIIYGMQEETHLTPDVVRKCAILRG